MARRIFAVVFFIVAFTLVLWACTDKPEERREAPDVEQLAVQQFAALETVTWTKVADEKQSFTVQGTQTVRYGVDGRWIEKQVTNRGECYNWYFGRDPANGVVKRCEVKSVVVTPEEPEEPEEPALEWVLCSQEKQTCTFEGSKEVRYGIDGQYVYKTFTNAVYCNNSSFGRDPFSGRVKQCHVRGASTPEEPGEEEPPVDPEEPEEPEEPEPGQTVTVSYGKDNSNFLNPERGFSMPIVSYSDNIKDIRLDQIQTSKANGYSVINRRYVMVTFKKSSISQAYLDHIQRDFNLVRQHGMKMVIRFSYTFNEASTDGYADTTLDWMLRHIEQLKPVLQRNVDVLAFLEAGFIGRWGEWNKSVNRLGDETNPQNTSAQSQLVNALLDAVPSSRMITLRYVGRKHAIFDSSALTEGQAYGSSREARVGHMNDYFTIDSWSGSTRTYLSEDTLHTVQGGEPIKTNGTRSQCPAVLDELATFHWSIMNIPGSDFAGIWRSGGCYDAIARRLGYRFYLNNATLPVEVTTGSTLEVTLNMTNEGFARPYNPRGFEMVLRNRTTGIVSRLPVNLGQDTRSFLPDPGRTENLTVRVSLPTSLSAGQYDLFLGLPDPMLSSRSEYSIRLANTNVWDSTLGANRLGSVIVK
jgi:hypothetical protein